MDFDKLQKSVEKLETAAGGFPSPDSMKRFAELARDILISFLKDRKEPVKPGKWFKDAAAKSIVPGDIAERADHLLVRWGGKVTPTDPKEVQDDAAKMKDLAARLVPVLKAYKKEKEEPPQS